MRTKSKKKYGMVHDSLQHLKLNRIYRGEKKRPFLSGENQRILYYKLVESG